MEVPSQLTCRITVTFNVPNDNDSIEWHSAEVKADSLDAATALLREQCIKRFNVDIKGDRYE